MKELNKVVEDIKVSKSLTLEEIVEEYYKSGGFVAKKIGVGSKILKQMLAEKNSNNFLSFPACIIATGCRGIIKDLIKNKLFNIIITTCGTLDHDFARIYKNYYHGEFEADDRKLFKQGINRLGNVFVPNESYGEAIEKNIQPILTDIYTSGKKELSTFELVWEIGKRVKNENSILYWCYKNQIPMIVPGITDGAFGTQLLMFMEEHKDFKIDVFKDEKFLSDIMFADKKSGALMIGGGISKHHTIWWNQFKGGLDFAVYITTAPEWDGSLSGARVQEGISWGKVKEDAKFVTIEGDATVILPLLIGPLL